MENVIQVEGMFKRFRFRGKRYSAYIFDSINNDELEVYIPNVLMRPKYRTPYRLTLRLQGRKRLDDKGHIIYSNKLQIITYKETLTELN